MKLKLSLSQIIELFSLSGLIIIGDTLVQRLEYHYDKEKQLKFKLDIKRTIGMGTSGLIWVGPLTMAWFPFLHRFMAKKMPNLVEGSLRYVLTNELIINYLFTVIYYLFMNKLST